MTMRPPAGLVRILATTALVLAAAAMAAAQPGAGR